MCDPDRRREILSDIMADFSAFLRDRGSSSEADTRAKVVTKVLVDVCGWPESEIDREGYSHAGYIDYRLLLNKKPHILVEAKRAGAAFSLPDNVQRKHYKLSGTLTTNQPIRDAIEQVRNYCDEEAIRYAVATNGDAWIVFRAIRDDIGWRQGTARVFPSLQHIYDNFTEFWNLLSYEALCSGSLSKAFSTTLRASRELRRIGETLFNANLPLRRNRISSDMLPLIRLVFEDIAEQEELDVLQSCYIHTGTLRTVANDLDNVITEAIPKFLADEGAVSVGQDHAADGFRHTIAEAVNVTRGELFLLLGGIGSGKSTFLKRYQKTIGKTLLAEKTLWFMVDFIRPPINVAEMERFVWATILDELRGRYRVHECERIRYVKEAFRADIDALNVGALSHLKQGTHKYDHALRAYLREWSSQIDKYVPKLVELTCRRLCLKPVLFIDNVDQLAPSYQAQIFLLAQRVAGLLNSITVIALREESYYTASVQNTFTAYNSRKFHIASPHFRKMLVNRIEYALRRLKDERMGGAVTTGEAERRQEIYDFLYLAEGAIEDNDRIARFIKAICYGNMRFALELFVTFLTSGATDVGKMLKIYKRDGWYNIAYHEFLKSIMLGDWAYYKQERSPIYNMFNAGSEPNASHFTAWRIIHSLIEHRGRSTREGMGYVELSRMVARFEETFDNLEDCIATSNGLVRAHLIEANTRSAESIEGASHVRVTSAGWYYLRHLIDTFAYLDLVLQDTPFNDARVESLLRQSVYEVNNLVDSESEKLERVRARFRRVELFLDYLAREEDRERTEFGLERAESPLGDRIVDGIQLGYQNERGWIDRRLTENRERFREEFSEPVYDDEEEILNIRDSEESENC